MFGAIKVTRKSLKRKFIYSGYGITFDRGDSWSFINLFVWNVVISVLKVAYRDILKILKISFKTSSRTNWWYWRSCWWSRKKCVIIILIIQKQNFVSIQIKMVIITIFTSMEHRYVNLRHLAIYFLIIEWRFIGKVLSMVFHLLIV